MNVNRLIITGVVLCCILPAAAQDGLFSGLANSLNNIFRISDAKSFSISPENLTGEKGKGGMATEGTASQEARLLGRGWKVNPFIVIEPGKTFTLAEINGQGAIEHIWMTPQETGGSPFCGCIGMTKKHPPSRRPWVISSQWAGANTLR